MGRGGATDGRVSIRTSQEKWGIVNYLGEFDKIPCYYGSKRPTIHWKQFTERRVPRAMQRIFFPETIMRNVAIVVREPLVVIDFDDEKLYSGWAEVNPSMTGTLTVKTGRGFHVYFFVEGQIYPVIAKGKIDVKSSGIVLVPPSLHENGTHYSYAVRAPILTVPDMDGLGIEFQEKAEYACEASGCLSASRIEKCRELLPLYDEMAKLTELKRVRGGWIGRCPFHADTNPSLYVYDDEHFYCFGDSCWAHRRRDVVDVIAWQNNCDIRTAISIILD